MRKLKNLIIIMILTFIGIINVNAEEQYSIKVNIEDASTLMEMSLEGINMELAYQNGYSYYIKFVNDNDSKPNFIGHPIDTKEKIGDTVYTYNSVIIHYNKETQTYFNNISIDDDWYMLDGYTTAYLIECKDYKSGEEASETNTCKVIDSPITVEKPKLPSLSQRYQFFLFTKNGYFEENTLAIYNEFPYRGQTGSHELNFKVGLINDENLLKKLAKKEAGSLEKLIEYAKNTNDKVFTGAENEFHDDGLLMGDFNVVEDAYYYIYIYYTNTDGVYRNLDDISVVMGKNGMLVNDVDWSKYNTKDELWEKFVEKYKKGIQIETLKEEGFNFDIQSTDNSLKVIYSNNEGINGETNFSYENGILTYIPSNDKKANYIDFELVYNSIDSVAALHGYDEIAFFNWKMEEREFTFEKDGLEYKLSEVEEEENGTIFRYNIFNSFKIDIRGLKSFETENKPEELKKNPSTATNIGYGILITILVTGILGYIYIKKQSKFPKHN